MTDNTITPESVETALNNINNGLVRSVDLDTLRALAARLAEVEAERDTYKARGDNHWETLRSIRNIATTTGDLERIIQWVNDAGQGYTETAETTLAAEMDRRISAEALVRELEAAADGDALTVAHLKGHADGRRAAEARIEELEAKLRQAIKDNERTDRAWGDNYAAIEAKLVKVVEALRAWKYGRR
jgi:hypothetical protein